MKTKIILSLSLMLFFLTARSQSNFSISGIVKDKTGETLPAATIFLDGTEKKTLSNDKGEYSLGNLSPGTYQLTVHFVGYESSKQNVIIQDKSMVVNATLVSSANNLKEVVVKSTGPKNKYLALFIKNFLGDTENGRSCRILNAKILRFSEKALTVTAKTNDFLEIENTNLGYKIRYLLRDFRLNQYSYIASYTGECIFENLKGTEEEMKTWEENRRKAYQGSLMHYLRSLYRDSLQQEGFLSFAVIKGPNQAEQVNTQNRLGAAQISSKADSNFVDIKFGPPLFVLYNDPTDTVNRAMPDLDLIRKSIGEQSNSVVKMHLDKATVDARGSLVDYRSFLVKGLWGTKRIGDQLPFEYVPEKIENK